MISRHTVETCSVPLPHLAWHVQVAWLRTGNRVNILPRLSIQGNLHRYESSSKEFLFLSKGFFRQKVLFDSVTYSHLRICNNTLSHVVKTLVLQGTEGLLLVLLSFTRQDTGAGLTAYKRAKYHLLGHDHEPAAGFLRDSNLTGEY